MGNKRGWLSIFIIFVLVGLIIAVGFFVVNRPAYYNLDKSYNLEKAHIIGYGVYNTNEENAFREIINRLKNEYNDGRMYIVLGDADELKMVSYEELARGNIEVIIGINSNRLPIKKSEEKEATLFPGSGKIIMEIEKKKYVFDLNKDEKSYFIVYENVSDEIGA